MNEPYRTVAERCEILAVALHDRGDTANAQLLWDADARIRELEAEAVASGNVRFCGAGLKGIRGSRADIDLVQHWQNEAIRAVYITERYKLWLNEAQRLAALVRSLGGDPEPSPSTPNDEAGFMPASQPSTSNDE